MPNEKIEVGYRHIGTFADVEYHHKFLLYTNKNGQQYTISGWTDEKNMSEQLPFGNIRIQANWPYNDENSDHIRNENAWYYNGRIPVSPQKQYRELITEAPDLSAKWAEMVRNAKSKDNVYPYDPIRQNSNTLADTVLREAGLPEPKRDRILPQDHLAPGSGNKLDKNLIPKSQEELGISDLRHVISTEEPKTWEMYRKVREKIDEDPNNMSQNGYEQPQYAQTRGLTFDDMPPQAREICRQCRELLVEFDREEGITRSEEDTDKIALAMGVQSYAAGLPEVQFIHIEEGGQINLGYESPQGMLKDTSIHTGKALSATLEENIAQSKRAEIDLALAAEQRRQEILAYQQSQSMGRSI